jgi:hypothetical protein
MRKGVGRRETSRMNRQNRHHFQKMMTDQKIKTYERYIDNVMTIVEKIQNKTATGPGDLKKFQEGSAFINLHGSKYLRSMNEHITGLIHKGKPLTHSDYVHLKSELGKTAKADLFAQMSYPAQTTQPT